VLSTKRLESAGPKRKRLVPYATPSDATRSPPTAHDAIPLLPVRGTARRFDDHGVTVVDALRTSGAARLVAFTVAVFVKIPGLSAAA
jgi:hypothetical protein